MNMKTIKIKDKNILKMIGEIRKEMDAARSGLSYHSTALKNGQTEMFKSIYEHFPETRGWNLRYNHHINEIMFISRDEDYPFSKKDD